MLDTLDLGSGETSAPRLPLDIKCRITYIQGKLAKSDKDVVRLSEDLIKILIKKEILSRDDLPKHIIDRIYQRSAMRAELENLVTAYHNVMKISKL